jgi:hypothetical protein
LLLLLLLLLLLMLLLLLLLLLLPTHHRIQRSWGCAGKTARTPAPLIFSEEWGRCWCS